MVRNAAQFHLVFSMNPHSLAGLKNLDDFEPFVYDLGLGQL
jgi:hypothetical protein